MNSFNSFLVSKAAERKEGESGRIYVRFTSVFARIVRSFGHIVRTVRSFDRIDHIARTGHIVRNSFDSATDRTDRAGSIDQNYGKQNRDATKSALSSELVG